MIGRDLLRWALNLVVGLPPGFVACVGAMLLLIPSPDGEPESRTDSATIFLLLLASHGARLIAGLRCALPVEWIAPIRPPGGAAPQPAP